MIRVNHYGPDATRGAVRASLTALGTALAEQGLPVDVQGPCERPTTAGGRRPTAAPPGAGQPALARRGARGP